MNDQSTALAIQPVRDRGLTITGQAGGISFGSMTQIVEFSQLMAKAEVAIPKFLRGNVGACLAVTLQAVEWEMTPFQVANKAYSVNDRLAFESQLMHAVILKRAPIKGRLKVEYMGEGPTRQCRVWVKLRDDVADEPGEVVDYMTPMFKDVKTKNSPLWVADPDQQFFYYASRGLCRRHFPDVLLGVYSRDEMLEAEPLRPQADDRSQAKALAANLAANAQTGGKGFDPAFVDAETGEIRNAEVDDSLLSTAQKKALQGRRIFDPWYGALSPEQESALASHMPALMKAANAVQHGASNEAAKIIEHDAPVETKAAPDFDFDVEMDAFEKKIAAIGDKADLLAFGEAVQKGGWYVAADEELREQAQTLFQDRVKELEKSEAKAKAKKPTQQAALEAGFEEIPHFQDDGPANAAEQEPSEAEKLLTDGRMAAINGVRKLKFWLGKLNAAQFELIKPHKESLEAAARQADEAL